MNDYKDFINAVALVGKTQPTGIIFWTSEDGKSELLEYLKEQTRKTEK